MTSRTSWVIAALLVGVQFTTFGCGSVTKSSGGDDGSILNPAGSGSGFDQLGPIPSVPSLGMMANFKDPSSDSGDLTDEIHAAAVITQNAKHLLDVGCRLSDGTDFLKYTLVSQPSGATEPSYLLGFDADPLRSVEFACPDGASTPLPRAEGFSSQSVFARILVTPSRPNAEMENGSNNIPLYYRIFLRLDPAYDWTHFFAVRYEDGNDPMITTSRSDGTFVLGTYPAGVPMTVEAFAIWVNDHIRVGDLQTNELEQLFFTDITLNLMKEFTDSGVTSGTVGGPGH